MLLFLGLLGDGYGVASFAFSCSGNPNPVSNLKDCIIVPQHNTLFH